MYQKLRTWAKSRHPNKSNKWIASKYWLSIDGNNWAFAARQKGDNPMRLLKHGETPIIRHEKVKGDASPYDGNLIYWSSRRGKHPEVTTRVATLLKKQKGKCTYCGLYFRESDELEVDHITPKLVGGKDEYKNLQLLHRHCHDVKTANDNRTCTLVRKSKTGGMHDRHQIIEEPDEGKLSRPVLKTSRRGDSPA